MALPDQIDRAAAPNRKLVGFEFMHRDAILARPASEREAAVRELVRARRCVLRAGGEHAVELLAILDLAEVPDVPAARA